MLTHRKHHDPHAHVIQPPSARLLRTVPLRFVRERGRGRRGAAAGLNMASFLDVLLVTVLFLLSSFSGAAESPTQGVDVPSATIFEDMIEAPTVAVSGGLLLVDGVLAGSTREIAESGRMAKLDELSHLLTQKRTLWLSVQPKKTFPGACVLQIDRDVPAVVVKSVFQTAVAAGYPNVSFMVKKLSPHAG